MVVTNLDGVRFLEQARDLAVNINGTFIEEFLWAALQMSPRWLQARLLTA